MSFENLKHRLIEIEDESHGILMNAQMEGRFEITPGENARLGKLDKEFRAIKNQLESVGEDIDDMSKSQGRKTDPDDVAKLGGSALTSRDSAGFKNLGELGVAVYNAGLPGRNVDPRLLRNAPSTIGTEGVGADGGYAVAPDFRNEIMMKVLGEESLLSRCDVNYTPSNSIEVPADETTPWQTTGGIQAYWDSEASQLDQSKPELKSKTIKLAKLTALIPVSYELLEDAPGLNAYLNKKVPTKFTSKLNTAIINGTGVGEPQGILNCGCLVTIDKESGQSADTVVYENIVNMWARLYGPSQARAAWLINQNIYPQLFSMSWEGTSSSVPAYMPANGLSGSPYGTLMGRPVIPTQACESLGDKGDIILADLEQYFVAMKAEGIRSDVSIHLWFDYDLGAFRFILRVMGQCWWASDITPENSSDNLGHFIALEARS